MIGQAGSPVASMTCCMIPNANAAGSGVFGLRVFLAMLALCAPARTIARAVTHEKNNPAAADAVAMSGQTCREAERASVNHHDADTEFYQASIRNPTS
jgi:hypothetical protein